MFQAEQLSESNQAREIAEALQSWHAAVGGWQGIAWHVGDLWWNQGYHSPNEFWIWRDQAGELSAFVTMSGENTVLMQVKPALRGAVGLEDQVLAWAKEQRPSASYTFHAFDSDQATLAWLAERGFQLGEWGIIYFRRSLDAPIEPANLPEGFVLRQVNDHDVDERSAAHCSAFVPSGLSPHYYRRLRSRPGYDPELDLIAVAPNGQIASFCNLWYDVQNRVGYFEPVGTRPEFRRLGLSQNVLREGFRRLQARGARECLVPTSLSNLPAQGLYRSLGFTEDDVKRSYIG